MRWTEEWEGKRDGGREREREKIKGRRYDYLDVSFPGVF